MFSIYIFRLEINKKHWLLTILIIMNTVLSRLNVVFAYTLSVLAAVTFGAFLSTYVVFPHQDPNVEYAVSQQIV